MILTITLNNILSKSFLIWSLSTFKFCSVLLKNNINFKFSKSISSNPQWCRGKTDASVTRRSLVQILAKLFSFVKKRLFFLQISLNVRQFLSNVLQILFNIIQFLSNIIQNLLNSLQFLSKLYFFKIWILLNKVVDINAKFHQSEKNW